jgi:DNA-binding beta-propeller fold protein YncE
MLRPISGLSLAILAGALALAGAEPAAAQIYSYQSTLGVAGVPGADNAHLNLPVAGVVDTVHGHFFVADSGNDRVQVYDTTSLALVKTIGVSGVSGADNAHFGQPLGVEFYPATNRIFVADAGNQRVQVFDATSLAYVATIGVTDVPFDDNAHFDQPGSVHVNQAANLLYVADILNQRVQVLNATTFAYVGTIGISDVAGNDSVHLFEPDDAEYNPATNEIVVADTGNGRLQIFNATTYAYVGTVTGTALNPDGKTTNVAPITAAVDPTTNLLLVPDVGPDARVQVLDATTYKYVATLGTTLSAGTGNSQFNQPFGIAVDPVHGRLFVGDASNDRVQVFSIAPVTTVASVLPGSRSVELGSAATIFASMINAGSTALSGCQIALPASAPAGLTLSYQTTNPATNALTGSPNTPVTIPGNNGSQSFVVSFQGSAAFSAPAMPLDFACTGAAPAAIVPGVDTVDLAMSSTPVADIIALSATATGNGIAEVPNGGAAAFAVASINVGATAPITVSVDTGSAKLPVVTTICETDPSNGQCLASPAASVSLSYAGKAAPTFSVFLQASGTIAFAPASSRVFVRFKDASGGLHGSTSVAIETE